MKILRRYIRRCDVVFAKRMEVGRSTIALVPLVVHQGKMNCLRCHVGLSVVDFVVLWLVYGSFGRVERVVKKRGTGNCHAAFIHFVRNDLF